FGKGNDFAAKITYSAKDPKGHLKAFRTSPALRVAVTVDMIATGTDVKPLECVFFMRDVRSGLYFEQMKGRGARTIDPATFQAVTDDAEVKTRFVIVDAVGVTEHEFVEPPLNREKSISLQKLLNKAATLNLTEDETATLASRLTALDQQLAPAERTELDEVAQAAHTSMRRVVRGLVDAVDPAVQAAAAAAEPDRDATEVVRDLLDAAIEPLAANPELRARILELRRAKDQMIDEVSRDQVLEAYGVVDPDKARGVVESWRQYLSDHRSEISAIELMYEAKGRGISFAQVQELADRIKRPPYNWTVDMIWNAYVSLEYAGQGRAMAQARHTATDLISLLRLEAGVDDKLVPYADQVRARYENWLARQQQAGVTFSETQRWWLDRMMSIVCSSAGITADDLDNAPFDERGGVDGALRDLGDRAGDLIEELNLELSA
ncbi:MAG: DEAD/DEAH box helicase, partial [Leucobacter sp.]|nr:DEAD/DEAH box helicase [Leucobacter sp.]